LFLAFYIAFIYLSSNCLRYTCYLGRYKKSVSSFVAVIVIVNCVYL